MNTYLGDNVEHLRPSETFSTENQIGTIEFRSNQLIGNVAKFSSRSLLISFINGYFFFRILNMHAVK